MGTSKSYRELLNKADKISRTNLDLFIIGENGSGRDWFVNYIAKSSEIEKIQSISFESEIQLLIPQKKGIILYLAKIENLNTPSQNLVYRAIEKRDLVLENTKIPIKRIFFSSNESLEKKVQDKEFRDDLYRKISSIQLKIPPLRDRKEDIPFYVEYFLEELSKKHKKKVPKFGDEFWELLNRHPWYGNLVELRGFLEAMLLFHRGRSFEVGQALEYLRNSQRTGELQIKVGITLEEYEKEIIFKNLQYNSWNRKKTADALGISERNLYRKISSYGLDKHFIND